MDKTLIPVRLIARTAKSVPWELVSRYQMPFSRDIEGMDLSKKFRQLKLTLYDGKSDTKFHVSHVRQMMAL